MNLDQIRAKLAQMNKTGEQTERVDYSNLFWKPELGKHTIRILPSAWNPEYPFTELKFHYGIGKYPMIALSNFGEQDPIEAFAKELKKGEYNKENWVLAGKLSPKTRIFAPVIVRGEEDKGVRLWNFGVTIYKALLALAEDEEIGDFTDPINGWDMTVEVVKGNPYPETSVRLRPKQSALSQDAALVEKWLHEQPKPLDSFRKVDYDYMKKQLIKHMDPTAEEAEDETPVAGVESTKETLPLEDEKTLPIMGNEKKPTKAKPYILEDTPAVKSKAQKFDSLFDEED